MVTWIITIQLNVDAFSLGVLVFIFFLDGVCLVFLKEREDEEKVTAAGPTEGAGSKNGPYRAS